MLDTLMNLVPNAKTRGVLEAGAGMIGLLTGRKVASLALFAKGFADLEKEWRKAHPEFHGNLADRWQKSVEFYEETHQNGVNRKLHIIGIPMIVGGAAGLLLFNPFRPLWFVSASSFSAGWILNFIGHGMFEKKAPAFSDDPLSFIAGPVWDFSQLFGAKKDRAGHMETVQTSDGPVTVINVSSAEAAQA
ncbi:MAG TPA: DUF962 domain-containing protein [Myxococcota bacterium]|jgi:hypothetical protein